MESKKKKIIGEGKDGIVYEYGNENIVKLLKKKGINNFIEIFIKKNFTHENIMTSKKISFNGNNIKFLEEKGIEVTKYVEKKSYEKRKRLCLQLCKGIEFLHRNGIIHGDIKPSNLLVLNNTLKVNDFSCSKIVSKDNIFEGIAYSYLYRPPEINLTFQSDIYALGCTIYEILNTDCKSLYKKIGETKIKCLIKLKDEKLNVLLERMISDKIDERPDIHDIIKFFEKDLNIQSEDCTKANCFFIQTVFYNFCLKKNLDYANKLYLINKSKYLGKKFF